ncbi:nucleotidyl transferase AbiEii/AbiGii toxin family protein [Candidatus Gottesmanbacteria bacterium]|nr:nucleotidyl transferase AbiEii/AbiGii toxin family protein [Candidatus Gottesmanbacteria bacterium]
MGKIAAFHFTPIQERFLIALLADPYIANTFYLTGGTALAACYLNHRVSEDIDLFSPQPLQEQEVVATVSQRIGPIAKTIDYVRIHDRMGYTIVFPNNQKLKVDIVAYPYEQLEKSQIMYHGLSVDSIADIGVNKLMTISQRTASKDYVDLYFILKQYTMWDLRHGVAHKFKMDIEPLYASSLYSNVDQLTTMPIMKKKLTLDQLKKFFLAEARCLAKTMVKP